jgi:hypothetical protein
MAGGSAGPHGRAGHPDRLTRLLTWCAVAGIGGALTVMIALSVAGPSRAVIRLRPAQQGPLLFFRLDPPQMLVAVAIWSAVAAGGAGVAAGLAALARGARPVSPRLLAGAALAAAAALTVCPPAGSTDTLDYASYGRMVVIGHDPYVWTPRQLRLSGDPIGRVAPRPWQWDHSVYGPLATLEQAAAAWLGGTSPGWILFWLKLWNSLAFAAVVIVADRLLRRDPARRTRAHLLWSVNPLLLWVLVAGGHVDALAAACGLLGLLLVRPGSGQAAGGTWWERVAEAGDPGPVAGLLAGVLIGAAADLKITFVLFGLGAAWAVRKSPRALSCLAAGGSLVLVPSYVWFGPPAIMVLFDHSTATGDNFYRLFLRHPFTGGDPRLIMVAVPVLIVTALLLMRRLPDGCPELPAARPAFVLALAWLLTWPYQRPWYDAMALCLLALYPASRLDWALLARLTAGVLYSTPGMPGTLSIRPLGAIQRDLMMAVVPATRLAALAAVAVLCLTAAWYPGEPLRPRLAGLVPLR